MMLLSYYWEPLQQLSSPISAKYLFERCLLKAKIIFFYYWGEKKRKKNLNLNTNTGFYWAPPLFFFS